MLSVSSIKSAHYSASNTIFYLLSSSWSFIVACDAWCDRHLDEDDGAGCVLERRVRSGTSTGVPALLRRLLQHLLLVPYHIHYLSAVRRTDGRQHVANWCHQDGECQASAAAEDAACGRHGNGKRSHHADAGHCRCRHARCGISHGRRIPAYVRYIRVCFHLRVRRSQ